MEEAIASAPSGTTLLLGGPHTVTQLRREGWASSRSDEQPTKMKKKHKRTQHITLATTHPNAFQTHTAATVIASSACARSGCVLILERHSRSVVRGRQCASLLFEYTIKANGRHYRRM